MEAELLYSTYPCDAFPETGHGSSHCSSTARPEPYKAGWDAMERFAEQLIRDAGQHNYTHLLFLSMGWNNDQEESLHRYNTLIQTTRRAASAMGNVSTRCCCADLAVGLGRQVVGGYAEQCAAYRQLSG